MTAASSGEARVCVLTGAASGIGRHLTGVLARAGFRVVATDQDLEKLEQAARAEAWPADRVLRRLLDVREPQAFRDAIGLARATFGRFDILLNVAGYLRPGYAHEAAPEEIDRHLDVNVKGVIHGTRAAAAVMVPQGHGHVVNVASLAGHVPVRGLGLYSTSKFAVRGFSLVAAHELRPHGVFVSAVCPDAVNTPMVDLQVDYPEAAISFSSAKMLTAEDVARAIVDDVLVRRPLEVLLPRGRGLLARLVGAWPELGLRLAPRFAAKGEARRQVLARRRSA
ncbi:MAG TPA: SDR family oxidoreductase [Vicinamibacteria bacterium]